MSPPSTPRHGYGRAHLLAVHGRTSEAGWAQQVPRSCDPPHGGTRRHPIGVFRCAATRSATGSVDPSASFHWTDATNVAASSRSWGRSASTSLSQSDTPAEPNQLLTSVRSSSERLGASTGQQGETFLATRGLWNCESVAKGQARAGSRDSGRLPHSYLQCSQRSNWTTWSVGFGSGNALGHSSRGDDSSPVICGAHIQDQAVHAERVQMPSPL